MKWKFGDTSGLHDRTNRKASLSDRDLACIMYARVTVTERDTPARQCTRTAAPFVRASSK